MAVAATMKERSRVMDAVRSQPLGRERLLAILDNSSRLNLSDEDYELVRAKLNALPSVIIRPSVVHSDPRD